LNVFVDIELNLRAVPLGGPECGIAAVGARTQTSRDLRYLGRNEAKKETGLHKSESMTQQYDHEIPVMAPTGRLRD